MSKSFTFSVLSLLILLGAPGLAHAQSCEPSETTLCLQDDRFQVQLDFSGGDISRYAQPGGTTAGAGTALDLGMDDTGAFGMTDPQTPDLLIKILDGVVLNDHFWVFASSTSDLAVELRVVDTETDTEKTYSNPLGRAFAPVLDTSAFPGPTDPTADVRSARRNAPRVSGTIEGEALLLGNDRFQIDVTWAAPDGMVGRAFPVEFNEGAGLFWYFSPSNLELLVRVVDGTSVNGTHWVLLAGITTVRTTVTVTDLETGATTSYLAPQEQPMPTVLDDDPFDHVDDGVRVASLGAVRAAGLQGSDWHDRQLIRATDDGTTATLYLTPRGRPFTPGSDPSVRIELGPGQTRVIEDLHELVLPGVDGAATVRLVPDRGSTAPLWRSWVYNRADAGELGMVTEPFDVDSDGWFGAGTTLAVILSPDGYRDNLDPTAGPDGLTGMWRYRETPEAEPVEVGLTLDATTTTQLSVASLLGLEPAPGATLELRITGGSGRVLLSRNHNGTNDPARDEMMPVSQP